MNGQDSNYPNSPYDSQHWWEGPPRANDGQDLTERFGGLSIDESDQSYCNPAPSSGGSTGIPEEFRSVRESLAKAKEARLKAEGMTGKGTAAAEARDMDTHQSLPLDVYRETVRKSRRYRDRYREKVQKLHSRRDCHHSHYDPKTGRLRRCKHGPAVQKRTRGGDGSGQSDSYGNNTTYGSGSGSSSAYNAANGHWQGSGSDSQGQGSYAYPG